MAEKYDDLARSILENVGGAENVASVAHCITRVRFKLKDESRANTAKIEALKGVIQVIQANGQYQVVVGNIVEDVYDAVLEAGNYLPVDLVGRPEPQHLPGPVVDLLEHLLHLFVGHPGEVRPLREELPYGPVRVLDCRLLPGVVRPAEVERHPSRRPAHLAVVGELLPPVRRHGLKRPDRERPDLRLRDLGRAVRPGPAAHEQARRPAGHGDRACRGRADHGVVLPVAEPRARVGLARAPGDLVVRLDPAARLLAPAPGAPAPAPPLPGPPAAGRARRRSRHGRWWRSSRRGARRARGGTCRLSARATGGRRRCACAPRPRGPGRRASCGACRPCGGRRSAAGRRWPRSARSGRSWRSPCSPWTCSCLSQRR